MYLCFLKNKLVISSLFFWKSPLESRVPKSSGQKPASAITDIALQLSMRAFSDWKNQKIIKIWSEIFDYVIITPPPLDEIFGL